MTENSLEPNQSSLTDKEKDNTACHGFKEDSALSASCVCAMQRNLPVETVSTEPPKEQPKLTRKQIGQLRRQYLTQVHGVVKACGHAAKFSATKPPSINCVDCWVAYFMTAVNLEDVHKVLTEQGVKALVARYGKKFVRQFHGFLAMSLMPKEEPKDIPQEII